MGFNSAFKGLMR